MNPEIMINLIDHNIFTFCLLECNSVADDEFALLSCFMNTTQGLWRVCCSEP